MNSEVRIARPGLRVTVVVGACLTVIVIALALLYRTEFSVILFGLAGTIVSYGAVRVIAAVYVLSTNRELAKIELEERRTKLRIIQLEADHKALEAHVLAIPAGQRIITMPDSNIRLIEALPGQYKLLSDPQALAAPAVDLLAALDTVQRGLIVGSESGSGKTTLLQWIVARRIASGSKVVVIDPHGRPGKWPAGAIVVGDGRDYAGIEKSIIALVQLMDKRYKQIGRGEVIECGHTPQITIIIDEYRLITRALGKEIGRMMGDILTEGRKASMFEFVASHSDRAEPLGLKGEYDLIDGFCVVRLSMSDGQHQATIDTGSGEVPASLPGPYHAPTPQAAADGFTITAADLTDPQPTPTEAEVLRLYDNGEKISNIADTIYGHGGNQNRRVEVILTRYNRL